MKKYTYAYQFTTHEDDTRILMLWDFETDREALDHLATLTAQHKGARNVQFLGIYDRVLVNQKDPVAVTRFKL